MLRLELDPSVMAANLTDVKRKFKALRQSENSAVSTSTIATTTSILSQAQIPRETPTGSTSVPSSSLVTSKQILWHLHGHQIIYVNTEEPAILIDQLTAVLRWTAEARFKTINLYLIGNLQHPSISNFISTHENVITIDFRKKEAWIELGKRYQKLSGEQIPAELMVSPERLKRVLDIIALMRYTGNPRIIIMEDNSPVSTKKLPDIDDDNGNGYEQADVNVLLLNPNDEAAKDFDYAKQLATVLQYDNKSLYALTCIYRSVQLANAAVTTPSSTVSPLNILLTQLRGRYDEDIVQMIFAETASLEARRAAGENVEAEIHRLAKRAQQTKQLRRTSSLFEHASPAVAQSQRRHSLDIPPRQRVGDQAKYSMQPSSSVPLTTGAEPEDVNMTSAYLSSSSSSLTHSFSSQSSSSLPTSPPSLGEVGGASSQTASEDKPNTQLGFTDPWGILRPILRNRNPILSQSGSLGSQPGSQLGSQLGSQPGTQLGSQLGSQPGLQLGSQLGSQSASQPEQPQDAGQATSLAEAARMTSPTKRKAAMSTSDDDITNNDNEDDKKVAGPSLKYARGEEQSDVQQPRPS